MIHDEKFDEWIDNKFPSKGLKHSCNVFFKCHKCYSVGIVVGGIGAKNRYLPMIEELLEGLEYIMQFNHTEPARHAEKTLSSVKKQLGKEPYEQV